MKFNLVPEKRKELIKEYGTMWMQVKASDFKFVPINGWLAKEWQEKVEGWNTKVICTCCVGVLGPRFPDLSSSFKFSSIFSLGG